MVVPGAPMTGSDVAQLLDAMLAYDIGHATDPALPEPALWDPDARVIYLDGRLDIRSYYAALARKLAELIDGDNVLLFRRSS
jgi:hypothetical protein